MTVIKPLSIKGRHGAYGYTLFLGVAATHKEPMCIHISIYLSLEIQIRT